MGWKQEALEYVEAAQRRAPTHKGPYGTISIMDSITWCAQNLGVSENAVLCVMPWNLWEGTRTWDVVMSCRFNDDSKSPVPVGLACAVYRALSRDYNGSFEVHNPCFKSYLDSSKAAVSNGIRKWQHEMPSSLRKDVEKLLDPKINWQSCNDSPVNGVHDPTASGYWKMRYVMQLQLGKVFVRLLTAEVETESMRWELGVANYLGMPIVEVRCNSVCCPYKGIVCEGHSGINAAVAKAKSTSLTIAVGNKSSSQMHGSGEEVLQNNNIHPTSNGKNV